MDNAQTPTDEQVERVARAIAKGAVNDSESWRNYTYAARDALSAMQPSPAEAAKVLLDACLAVQGMNTDDMTPVQERLDNLGRAGWADLRAIAGEGQ